MSTVLVGAGILVAALVGALAARRLSAPPEPETYDGRYAARPPVAEPIAPPSTAPLPVAPAEVEPANRGPSPLSALDVVDAFQVAYEARDLRALGTLFARDATKGDLSGREAIIADYQRFFENAHDISYVQPSTSVEPREDHVLVRAPFTITYRDANDRPVEVRGIASWRVVQRGEATLISTLDFELDVMDLPR